MLFFGLLYIITNIISASGRPNVSLVIGAVTLAASAALNALLIPVYGLTGGAIGTTASMFLGVLIGGGYLLVKFGALMPGLSFLRIAACSALIYLGSLAVSPESKLMILVKLALLSLVYLAGLVISREIGRDDLTAIRKILKK
jgi:stage V sporulation protein B